MATTERLNRFEALKEALPGGRGLEPTGGSKAVPGGAVVALWLRSTHFVVSPCARCSPVQPRAHVHCFRETLTDGLHGGLVMVAHDGVRRDSTGRERAAEERLRHLGVAVVAVVAEQHVEDLAVLVDGPVQGAFLRAPVPNEEALVHLPCPAGPSTVLADRRRVPRPEGLDPPQDGPLGDVDAPLGEEHHHAGGGERVAQLPADRQQDHLRRPTVPREGRHRSRREGTVAGPTHETLAAGAVAAVALGGRTPARGTKKHTAWTVPATDDVADS